MKNTYTLFWFSQPLIAPPPTCGVGDNDPSMLVLLLIFIYKTGLRYCIPYVCCTNVLIHGYLVQENEISKLNQH